jgi:hypothetical protein
MHFKKSPICVPKRNRTRANIAYDHSSSSELHGLAVASLHSNSIEDNGFVGTGSNNSLAHQSAPEEDNAGGRKVINVTTA